MTQLLQNFASDFHTIIGDTWFQLSSQAGHIVGELTQSSIGKWRNWYYNWRLHAEYTMGEQSCDVILSEYTGTQC
jgi:hypothetical protein